MSIGPSREKINVALQRPTVNVKEAENAGEQAVAAARHAADPQVKFARHGTFGPPQNTGLDGLWKD